jgi:hypothetical protein
VGKLNSKQASTVFTPIPFKKHFFLSSDRPIACYEGKMQAVC